MHRTPGTGRSELHDDAEEAARACLRVGEALRLCGESGLRQVPNRLNGKAGFVDPTVEGNSRSASFHLVEQDGWRRDRYFSGAGEVVTTCPLRGTSSRLDL